MNQSKIGKFIASLRKEKGMTQKELAVELNLSDKTISKWECGNGIPDASSMLLLSEIFSVSVNDILSGERLSVDEYGRKAEENMKILLEENHEVKKTGTTAVLVGEVGIIAACLGIVALCGGMGSFLMFLDLPSLFFIVAIEMLALMVTGLGKDFINAIRLFLHGNSAESEKVHRAAIAVKTVMLIAILVGVIETIVGFMLIFYHMSDPAGIGPSMSVAWLSTLYSLLIVLLLLPVYAKLKSYK